MPKQSTVMMGRRLRGGASTRGGRGRGRGQSASATSRAKDSTTPAAEPKGPPVKLKINMSIGRGQQSAARPSVIDFDQLHEQQAEEDEEEELPVAEPADGARRSGRDRKPPKLDDYYVRSEIEDQFTSSTPKADSDDNYESSPPARTVLSRQPQGQHASSRKPRRSRKSNFKPSLAPVTEHFATSDTLATSSPVRNKHHDPSELIIDQDIQQMFDHLSTSTKVHIDLPMLVNAADSDLEKPYTAQCLTHLYILAYRAAHWNICDLISDTWIRAFHALRRRDSKHSNKEAALWRPNPSKYMQSHKGFDTRAPNYDASLPIDDPELHRNATGFHATLLCELYAETRNDSGARLLWADAMALCGSKLEASMKKTKNTWPPDLLYDVMCTSMRLVRRKLTLKIEESAEGAWCKRYHEHSRHGLPCYRKVAYERKVRGDETSDEDEDEVDEREKIMEAELGKDGDRDDDLARMMAEELGRGEKRDLEDDANEMGLAKKMRIGEVEREVLDVDAEGASDDE